MWFFIPAFAGFDTFVADPAETLLADPDTPAGFRIIALSNAAEACVHRFLDGTLAAEAATRCVDRLAEAALDPRISPWEEPGVGVLGEHNLYATHLAIVLAARDRVHPGACDVSLHQRVAEHLAERSLAHPDGVARSFPSSPARWPADQAATLYALHRYDTLHGATLSVAPLAQFLGWVERARTTDGLLPSEHTGTEANASVPRGSAMTWTVRYLAAVVPAEAARLWTATRSALLVHVGPATGVREWPRGVDHLGDIDSGPIVAGMGASATGFAIGASRAVGDLETHRALLRTEQLGRAAAATDDRLAKARDSSLGVAISENQRSLVAW